LTAVLQWQPEAVNSADLEAGLKAVRELRALPVPAVLGKQLSNYALRAERVLAARSAQGGVVSAGEVPKPGSDADHREAMAHLLTWMEGSGTEILRIAEGVRKSSALSSGGD
jgi:hypothetical protein